MQKTIFLVTFILQTAFSLSSFAQNSFYSEKRISYEADGLDLWELPRNADIQAAMNAFDEKCKTEIPARVQTRMKIISLDQSQLTITTTPHRIFARGYGNSLRCLLEVKINANSNYTFDHPARSEVFYDILNSRGEVTTSSQDQCKTFISQLEKNAASTGLFDRHALVEWAHTRNGTQIETCVVTYVNMKSI